jgi:hypothetical protein
MLKEVYGYLSRYQYVVSILLTYIWSVHACSIEAAGAVKTSLAS